MNTLAKLKILYLEDNPDDAVLVERALRKENIIVELQRVDTRTEFIEAIRSHAFDVILSDHSLPQFNSNEALQLCNRAHIKIPFILVTGTVSEEFAVKCLKLGADDYVLKSNLIRLPTAILNSIRQRNLTADRLAAELALRHQNEELVKINRELDGFVYSVSHNLRAPLSSVLGLLNLAKEEGQVTSGPMQSYLSMMEKSIIKLDDTIKEILNYSRNARLELTREEVNLEELIKECIEKFSFHEGFDQLSILMECSDNKIACWSDRYRLSMVLVNLLSNAIKYRDPLKAQSLVRIKTTINDERISIVFQDNGIGISNELLGRVFDMFYRGTTKSKGAGLGLFIVKETIQKLRGTIQVSSSLGNGATFEISIPNEKAAPQLSSMN